MDEIVVSKRPNGRFSAFSAACGYTRAERAFLKKHAFSPRNPLFANGPVRFVTVNGKDGVRARVMTGADRVYEARTGCKRGYFALLDSAGDEDAVRAALEEACRLQREWGNVEMVGPLSPDGSGFLCGVGAAAADEVAAEDNPCGVRIAAGNSAAERELPQLETVDETCGVRVPEENPLGGIAAVADNSRGVLTGACNPAAECVLLKLGARAETVDEAYCVRVPEENPLRETAARAASRFGLRVELLKAAPFHERWLQRILALSGEREKNEVAGLLTCLRPLVDGTHSFAVCAGEDVRGYLLALRERKGRLRFTTLLTKPGAFSAPAAAMLLSAAADACIESGEKWVEASVIRRDNLRSRALPERFRARVVRRYTRYILNVSIN